MPQLFESIFAELERRAKIRPQGKGYLTTCPNPAHQDRNPSFFLYKSGAGKCYSQCNKYWKPNELAELLGIDLPDGGTGLTLKQLADAKGLPEDFLRSVGVADGISGRERTSCVDIPYPDESGTVAAVRKRLALFGSPQFIWRRGDHVIPYGLEDLKRAKAAGYVVIVEGESDRWTLLFNSIPTLAVPGASTWKEGWREYLAGVKAYIWNEPDPAGDSLLAKVSQDIPDLLVITPPQGIKDPSELYQYDHEAFKEKFQQLMVEARPASELVQAQQDSEHKKLYEKSKELLHDPAVLNKAINAIEGLGLVGERRNAGIIHLAVRSRATKRPNNLEVNSPSSTGKTYTVTTVLALESPESVYELTAGSERALIYTGETLENRIIYFQEPEGLADGVGAAVVKSLIWEGRLKYDTVVKENGKFVGQHIEKDGPTGLIITSTKPLDEQVSNRLFRVEVNDSEDQTRRILTAIADSVNGHKPNVDLEAWHAMSRVVRVPEEVMIHYGRWLAERVSVSTLRIRRDFTQLLTFIMASAVEHKYQRQRAPDGRIIATAADYAHVYSLVGEAFQAAQAEGIVKADRDMVQAVTELSTPPGGKPGERTVTQAEARAHLGLSKSSASYRVNRLLALGYVVNTEDRKGKPMKLIPGAALPDQPQALPSPCQLVAYLRETGHSELVSPWVDPVTGEHHECNHLNVCVVPSGVVEPPKVAERGPSVGDGGSSTIEPLNLFGPSDAEGFKGSTLVEPPEAERGPSVDTPLGFNDLPEVHTHTCDSSQDPRKNESFPVACTCPRPDRARLGLPCETCGKSLWCGQCGGCRSCRPPAPGAATSGPTEGEV